MSAEVSAVTMRRGARTAKDERVLLFGLFGSDAAMTQEVLQGAHVETEVCSDIDAVVRELDAGAAALLVTEESLTHGVVQRLVAALARQPSWSDLPLLLSVAEHGHDLHVSLGAHVNVVPMERPVRVSALNNTVRSALRARRRQYETRDLLRDLGRITAEVKRERDRTAALHALATGLSSARLTREVAHVALSLGTAAAGAPRGLVTALAEGGTRLDVILTRGLVTEPAPPWKSLPISGATPLTDVVRTGVEAFFETHEAVMQAYPHLAPEHVPSEAALAVLPMSVGGRTFGAMAFLYATRSFSEADREHLLAVARLCAQAMDRAFLFDLSQRERQRAEEANRTKDEFLAMVSHELRTPLNAMLGWTRMLRSGRLAPERGERALETIERNALAQTQLIEDLLDITRITTGKLRLSVGPVDLTRVVEAAVESQRPAAEARGVSVEVAFEPGSHVITGDEERLQQVVWNLLSNAVKFTSRGGSVVVRVRATEDSAEVVVEDTGLGIPPAFLPHVFERFRQAQGGSTRSYGGLGLGLAIVKHLVELHGGTIRAESEGEGHGTRFVVRIPLAPVAQTFTAPVQGSITPSGPPAPGLDPCPPGLAGLRVLVVDDEPDARELLEALLERCEVTVASAPSAAEGFELLKSWRPDVLLSDVGMPVEDGHAFLQKVRRLAPEEGGETPAVALTAYAGMEDRRRALLAGFNLHLPKPIDVAQLLLVLADLGARRG